MRIIVIIVRFWSHCLCFVHILFFRIEVKFKRSQNRHWMDRTLLIIYRSLIFRNHFVLLVHLVLLILHQIEFHKHALFLELIPIISRWTIYICLVSMLHFGIICFAINIRWRRWKTLINIKRLSHVRPILKNRLFITIFNILIISTNK